MEWWFSYGHTTTRLMIRLTKTKPADRSIEINATPTTYAQKFKILNEHDGNLVPRVFVPLDQRSWSERPWKRLIGCPKIMDFRLNCACLVDKDVAQSQVFLFPLISIVFKTNQNRSCNETLESRSFCQACVVRNEDLRNFFLPLRNEIDIMEFHP